VGHGFSYPTVEETLLPDGQVNSDLKPESGVTFEWGSRFFTTDGNLYFDVGTYLMLIDDLLVTERITEDIFTGKNAGNTKHLGIEIQGVWRFNQNENHFLPKTKLDLAFSSSRHRFSDFIDDGMDHSGNKLPGVPSNTFTGGLNFSYNVGLYGHVKFIYAGSQYLDDQNSRSYESYSRTNLKIGYRFQKWEGRTEFYSGISNLFNQQYASMLLVNAPSFGGNAPRYYYPGQPRSYFVGFSVSF
jgi:iron complex outermembrane receptor protein